METKQPVRVLEFRVEAGQPRQEPEEGEVEEPLPRVLEQPLPQVPEEREDQPIQWAPQEGQRVER